MLSVVVKWVWMVAVWLASYGRLTTLEANDTSNNAMLRSAQIYDTYFSRNLPVADFLRAARKLLGTLLNTLDGPIVDRYKQPFSCDHHRYRKWHSKDPPRQNEREETDVSRHAGLAKTDELLHR